jgi:hypothetical protein
MRILLVLSAAGGFSATQTDKIWLKKSASKVNSGRVDRARWNSYFSPSGLDY